MADEEFRSITLNIPLKVTFRYREPMTVLEGLKIIQAAVVSGMSTVANRDREDNGLTAFKIDSDLIRLVAEKK